MNVLQHTRNELNLYLQQNRPARSYRDILLTVQLLKLPNEILAPSLSPSTGIVHVRLFFSDTEITLDSLSDSVTGSLFGLKIVDTFIAVDALANTRKNK